jgi:hypothetical protein
MREIECTRWFRSFVFASWLVRWRGMSVSWVVVGESASALGDRRVCVQVV